MMGKKSKRVLNYNVALPSPRLSEHIKPRKLSQAYRNMSVSERALFFHTKQQWGSSYLKMNIIDGELISTMDKAERSKFIEHLNKLQDEMKCQWAVLVTQLKKALSKKDRHTTDNFKKFVQRKAAFDAGIIPKLAQTKLTADKCAFRCMPEFECKTHDPNCTRTDG